MNVRNSWHGCVQLCSDDAVFLEFWLDEKWSHASCAVTVLLCAMTFHTYRQSPLLNTVLWVMIGQDLIIKTMRIDFKVMACFTLRGYSVSKCCNAFPLCWHVHVKIMVQHFSITYLIHIPLLFQTIYFISEASRISFQPAFLSFSWNILKYQ
jgi:hypothetical protein